jgi:hypothetical protein
MHSRPLVFLLLFLVAFLLAWAPGIALTAFPRAAQKLWSQTRWGRRVSITSTVFRAIGVLWIGALALLLMSRVELVATQP